MRGKSLAFLIEPPQVFRPVLGLMQLRSPSLDARTHGGGGRGGAFWGLSAGGQQMQVSANVGIDLISVIQALIIIFVAAPALISAIYRLKAPAASTQISKGWGS